MKGKRLVCAVILALLLLPTAARADVLLPGMKPPRNEQSEAFVELFQDKITGWDDSYYGVEAQNAQQFVLWRYPGSGQVARVMSGSCPGGLEVCYVDNEGRYWGYVGYLMGSRLSWVCLSDPTNENIPADPEIVAAVREKIPGILFWENAPAVILVTGIIAATGAMIYVFWYKGKKTK